MTSIPKLFRGLCDDAALFPPGNAPLGEALSQHRCHRTSGYDDLVGPLVFPAPRLGELHGRTLPDTALNVSLTVPTGPADVAAAWSLANTVPGIHVVAVEVGTPQGTATAEGFDELARFRAAHPLVDVFVEVPRDSRRDDYLAALSTTAYSAKFRTGGIVADAYPDEAELADAIAAVVGTNMAFKATAGLHHAVRNTDPDTGFEQHGFLNILLAVTIGAAGGDHHDLVGALAERSGTALARVLNDLTADQVADTRRRFRSFGTCSITDPLTELGELGLIDRTPESEGLPV
ncbi:hypothetical protein ABH922_000336 [Rhodococcus sp. 27YEA15]|uniref:hypothetical protein n=1 Tax=Rhodococcus sp. 27YEA15 TaxID=3156259 RepID=UPI003C7B5FE1